MASRATPAASAGGDAAPASWLAQLLALERDGDTFFAREPADTNRNGRLFGGLIAAQALAAAAATVDGDTKPPHSLHTVFVRGGRPEVDVELVVERTRDGRSFDTRRVSARQDGRVILEMLTSFHVDEPGADAHPPAQPVPAAEDCTPLQGMIMAERFEMRGPDPSGAFTGPPHWVRYRDAIEGDPMLRACALTYMSDIGLMITSRPPDAPRQLGPEFMTASLDHSIWFHRPYDPNRWHCYQSVRLNNVGARGLALGSLYDEGGSLVASMTQEALWRRARG